MAKRIVFLVTVFVLVFSLTMSIGCTIAWIFTSTDPVVNTFEYGDINIDLKEDGLNDDGTLNAGNPVNGNTYKFVPGDTLKKRPYVIVKEKSEACWLFIEVTPRNNTFTGLSGDIIKWDVDTGIWTKLDGEANVWYRSVDAATATAGTTYDILKDDCVTVNEYLTKAMINSASFETPNLTFTAYAVQSANLMDADSDGTTVDEAWDIAKP